ncbi:two-component regulator propeller domain-containing protein [Hoylesella loescheii]|uniref:two-component regulator propeller domain-containing protein n=1 Tax=Hoylesella loescheii TaxID=840 RepID=UPI00248D57A0|nr:two-component regulator propeller domain-containing protein [Hoylesella loescheii]
MQMKKIRLMIAALLLLVGMTSRGNILFRHIGVESGLSQSTVLAILQDRTGLMWIGTKSGLNRYDGTLFKWYYSYPDGHSLGSSYINALFEDANGRIWIGTDCGVWIYSPLTDSFTRFDKRSADGEGITNMVNVIKGHGDKIYITTNEQGVFCYDLRHNHLSHFRLKGYPNVAGMAIGDNGAVWLGLFGGGLYTTDHAFRTLTPFRTQDGQTPFAGNIVSAILPLGNGRYAIGTDRQGLSLIDAARHSFEPIVASLEGKELFVRNLILNHREIWAATEQGMLVYNLDTHATQHFTYNPMDPFSISDNPLYCLYKDREGGLWAGSYFGGLNYLPAIHPVFERFVPQGSGNGLHGRRVREMVMDKQGKIWIGTEDGGLNCMEPDGETFSHIAASNAFPNVHGLCMDGNELWVGTFASGLKIIDTRTHQLIKAFKADGRPGSLRDNTIFSIARSPQGVMYLGTIRGLCTYIANTQTFVYDRAVPPVLINDVSFDSRGNLWLATQTNGVFMRHNGRWINFRAPQSGLTSDKALSIFEDSEGTIWVTTQGGGVCRFSFSTRRFKPLQQGALNSTSTFFRMEEDGDGVLWLSGYAGFVRYDPRSGDVRTYNNRTMLLDNQFNYNSSLIDKRGRIYFGSLSGIVRFSPSALKKEQRVPRLVATDLYIGNEHVDNFTKDTPLEQNIVFTRKLSLAYNQNSFRLHVVPLSYSRQNWASLEYKLEGFDKGWQPMGADFFMTYANLPAGSYQLVVRMKDQNGKAYPGEYKLDIDVRPFFLFSFWAKLFYVVLLGVLVWLFMRYWNRRSETRRRQAMEAFETRKEQELYQSKIHFFTNVAHEIRTPLTLILGPLENILGTQKVKDNDVKEDLNIMYENTRRLTDLINQLLDFRKTEKDGLRLNFEYCNLTKLVTDIYNRFRSAMREKNINATLSLQGNNLHGYVDHEGFTKIVSNLVNNAVKYCLSYISVTLKTDDTQLFLTVANDGNIIPMDLREKIFEPFFHIDTAEHSTSGTGIGLALARSLAELHNGHLCMGNEADMNVFVLTLPLAQDVPVRLGGNGIGDVTPMNTESTTTQRTQAKPHTLLLVEDNVQMLEYEKRCLEKEYNIVTATDGEEALLQMERNDVNLVVTDVMMEPMDGMELCRRIKYNVNLSHIPVIILTAVTSERGKMEGMESGADAYIVKPFSMDFLSQTVQNLLRQREEIKKMYATSPFVSASLASISPADADFLERLKAAVMRNIGNSDFNVDLLAAEMNMSRTSLNRKVRGTLDQSPNNYIRIERLKAAAEMLKSGDKKVNEVCYNVGFSSPSYFTKCFYEQFGILPKEFNKEQ